MIQLEVWGNYALLSRPELKVERVSYEVLTPSAARGIVEAIYYHPGLRWKIRKIYVMNPIRFTNIRRNEVKSKILCSDVRSAMQGTGKELYLATPQQIVQRAAMVLQDVHYVIEAEFEMTDRAAPSDNPGASVFIPLILGAVNFLPHSAHGPAGQSRPLRKHGIWDSCYMTLTTLTRRT